MLGEIQEGFGVTVDFRFHCQPGVPVHLNLEAKCVNSIHDDSRYSPAAHAGTTVQAVSPNSFRWQLV